MIYHNGPGAIAWRRARGRTGVLEGGAAPLECIVSKSISFTSCVHGHKVITDTRPRIATDTGHWQCNTAHESAGVEWIVRASADTSARAQQIMMASRLAWDLATFCVTECHAVALCREAVEAARGPCVPLIVCTAGAEEPR